MTAPAFKAMSVEDYLRTEPDSPYKREYVNGFVYVVDNSDEMRGQAGSSKAHARIISRVMRRVEAAAEAQGCRAFASEIKLRIDGQRSFYYPDVMVACGPETDDSYSETAPCLLVEVLSRAVLRITRASEPHRHPLHSTSCSLNSLAPLGQKRSAFSVKCSRGTAHTDRHAKYGVYTALPSLQTYLIVDQYERRVYAYKRSGESWNLTEYVQDGTIPLVCLGIDLTLHEIYDGILTH